MTSARRGSRRASGGRPSYETWEVAGSPSIERIITALREGRCPPDRMFDSFLSKPLRAQSNQHWTPLAAVLRVAEWLNDFAIGSVLDIGSGVGRFCVSAALACPARFIGIEQRPNLVAEASRLAQAFGVADRVRAGRFAFSVLTGLGHSC